MNDESKRAGVGQFLQRAREFLYGFLLHGMVDDIAKSKAQREHLFMLLMEGDMLGIPIIPNYYSLRLLPYHIPYIQEWKRNMLRERDLFDSLGEC